MKLLLTWKPGSADTLVVSTAADPAGLTLQGEMWKLKLDKTQVSLNLHPHLRHSTNA